MTTKTKPKLSDRIAHLSPCSDAVAWLDGQPSWTAAWHDCRRGDYMLWLLGKLSGEPGSEARRKLVLCACECARLALPHVRIGEERPLKAIETAERWARSEDGVSLDDVRRASAASASAAYAAASAAAAASASAAYAASDAYASAAYAAQQETLAACADIVRKHYLKPPTILKGESS